MTIPRLFAILLIFASTAVAWFILGASVSTRTSQSKIEGGQQVASLWGGRHSQVAPRVIDNRILQVSEQVTQTDDSGQEVTTRVKKNTEVGIPLELQSSSIEVRLNVDHRRKGLLWHDTYTVDFNADYTVSIPSLTTESLAMGSQENSASSRSGSAMLKSSYRLNVAVRWNRRLSCPVETFNE